MSKAKGKAAAAVPSPDASLTPTPPADPLASLSVTSLASHVASLQTQLLELRQSRALVQHEASLLLQHHSTLLTSNTLATSHLTNVASAVERLSESSRSEVKVYQQKTTHLNFAHHAALQHLTTQHADLTHSLDSTHQKALTDLNAVITSHFDRTTSHSIESEDEFRRLRESHKKELVKLKENFERVLDGVDAAYQQKVEALRQSMELRCTLELHEVEERKNKHINELIVNFDKSFQDIKLYYQQITADNITLIRELQAEIVDIKKSQEKKEKQILTLSEQNTQLTLPLQESNKNKAMLQTALTNYEKNRTTLTMLRQTTNKKRGEVGRTRERLAQLERQHNELHEETVALKSGYKGALDAQQSQYDVEVAPLRKSLQAHEEVFEYKRAQFQSVLRASGLESRLVGQLIEKLDGLLGEKGRMVSGLMYEVDKCKKGYDDMRRVMEAKMEGFGIQRGVRGKREKRMEFINEGRGTQPADLILR